MEIQRIPLVYLFDTNYVAKATSFLCVPNELMIARDIIDSYFIGCSFLNNYSDVIYKKGVFKELQDIYVRILMDRRD